MKERKPNVLILYNIPRAHAGVEGHAWLESDAGVLDELEAVAQALDKLGLRHRTVGATRLSELPSILSAAHESVVFNLVEGFHQNTVDVNLVPALINAYGKSSTGNDTACLSLSLDKWRTKAVLAAAGLPVPRGVLIQVGEKCGRLPFDPPYIVKPVSSDASEGIDTASVIRKGGKALAEAVKRIHQGFGQSALVEEYIDGRELNIGIMERNGALEVLPIAEIDFSAFDEHRPKIIGYSAKWLADTFEYQNTTRVVPTKLPAAVARRVRQLALAAWRAVGCSDYARVDMRLANNKDPYILEVNPNPDITREVGYDAALTAAGIPYEDFIGAVVRNAAGRLEAAKEIELNAKAEEEAREGAGVAHSHIVKTVRDEDLGADRRIRRTAKSDRAAIGGILEDTRFFREDEVEIALEVLDDALKHGASGHYQSFTIDCDGRPAGWVCFGPTPCTVATYDIYWIAVDPAFQGRGLGKALMDYAERRIFERGGRISVVETSGRETYMPTQQFYLRVGYTEEARIDDFYAPGDAKVVYIKRLS